MKSKRTIAWLLTLLTIGSTLIACSDDSHKKQPDETKGTQDVSTDASTDSQTESRELTDLEIRQSIDDGIGEADFGEKNFRIAITGSDEKIKAHYYVDSEATDDPCNDAVYKRNLRIEERLNVLISTVEMDNVDHMIELVQLDQNEAELYAFSAWRFHMPVEQKILYDWYDIPVVDLKKPWYNQVSNDQATMNGTLYSLYSSLSLTSLTKLCAVFFNERLVENYQIGKQNLYDLVNDGKWTIDKFIEYTRNIYEDVNQNNERDDGDLFGMNYSTGEELDAFQTAFGIVLTENDPNGTITFTLDNQQDRFVSAIDKMREYHEMDGVWTENSSQNFVNGNAVFSALYFETCFDVLREMEDVYQILPYPKWDEAQEDYYTAAQDEYHLYAVPKTVREDDFTFVGTVTELLSAETYKYVYPVYYDNALKGRYSKDPQTAKMVDLIVDGSRFEFSYQFSFAHFNKIAYLFRNLVNDPKNNFASTWAMAKRGIDGRLPKFYELFED